MSSDFVILNDWRFQGSSTKIIRSDEGLTLETSAFQIFHGGNFTFINSFDKTKFLFQQRSNWNQTLMKQDVYWDSCLQFSEHPSRFSGFSSLCFRFRFGFAFFFLKRQTIEIIRRIQIFCKSTSRWKDKKVHLEIHLVFCHSFTSWTYNLFTF